MQSHAGVATYRSGKLGSEGDAQQLGVDDENWGEKKSVEVNTATWNWDSRVRRLWVLVDMLCGGKWGEGGLQNSVFGNRTGLGGLLGYLNFQIAQVAVRVCVCRCSNVNYDFVGSLISPIADRHCTSKIVPYT